MKCYKLLSNKDLIKNNIGNYIILIIILIYIISLILFIYKGYNQLITEFNLVINNELNKNKKDKNKNNIEIKNNKNNPPKKNNFKIQRKNSAIINRSTISIDLLKTNGDSNYKSNSKIELNKDNLIDINDKNNLKLNDFELNSLDYKEALKIDKRNYYAYYLSLLKTKHLLIFTFYIKNDYNSKIIKICLFFFFLALYITINALFFNDSTMHKIYIDKGKYNFIYQLPQIIYSSLVSNVIISFIKFLSLTEKEIIDIKRKGKKIADIFKCLKIKFIFYFLVSFLFLIFFWYYLVCFCSVYKNTQIHLFSDTFISFGLSLLYPFGLCLLPGLFRIPSLAIPNSHCLYKFSKILQMI